MRRSQVQAVWRRARNACEYCQTPIALHPGPFQIDHVIAQKHRGPTRFDNLALSCLQCNSRKGPNIAGLDPLSGQLVRLFNPRTDRWAEHFQWSGPLLEGKTAIGRATIEVLAMNSFEIVESRAEWIKEGVFPLAD